MIVFLTEYLLKLLELFENIQWRYLVGGGGVGIDGPSMC